MKKLIFALLFPFYCHVADAQQKEAAEELVKEGIPYHDKGDFEGALSRYNKALDIDKNNLFAMTEKAMTLNALKQYEEAIALCRQAITSHPGDKGLRVVYVTYGNSTDGLNKTDQSIAVYDEGISQFPDYYQLHFNKGITLSGVKKYSPAQMCFQQSALLNPGHASSHNAIARLSDLDGERIAALLAYCRFLSLEPTGKRAVDNLELLRKIMKANVKKGTGNEVTVNFDPAVLDAAAQNGKPSPNNFSGIDMILSMATALDYDDKNKDKTEVEQFLRKFESVCSMMQETQKDQTGFFWTHYAPYFIAMQEQGNLEVFSYIVFASAKDAYIQDWLTAHEDKVETFFKWSKAFPWSSARL